MITVGKIGFKSQRIAQEFDNLGDDLKGAVYHLADHLRVQYEKKTVLTCILRTAEENAGVGGAKKSLHMSNRAVDVRTNNLNLADTIKQDIAAWFLSRYPKKHWEFVIHGTIFDSKTEHFHIGQRVV